LVLAKDKVTHCIWNPLCTSYIHMHSNISPATFTQNIFTSILTMTSLF